MADKKKVKKDEFFFVNFVEAAEIAKDTAAMLRDLLNNFEADTLSDKLSEIHALESRGDAKKHEMIAELVRAFITPIEREDILALSQNIDDVTDGIEDIAIHLYTHCITTIRPEAQEFSALLVRACGLMVEMLAEFKNFKKSTTLADYIRKINDVEEEGDRIYREATRRLFAEEKDPVAVIAWRELFVFFEKSCDTIEHVADIVESTIIANS
ncbi:MAG: DUF47 domain-containing protein [Clostridia bacterium]|nr:DUF47 domain-containing protein [Clostridia bacterium]